MTKSIEADVILTAAEPRSRSRNGEGSMALNSCFSSETRTSMSSQSPGSGSPAEGGDAESLSKPDAIIEKLPAGNEVQPPRVAFTLCRAERPAIRLDLSPQHRTDLRGPHRALHLGTHLAARGRKSENHAAAN